MGLNRFWPLIRHPDQVLESLSSIMSITLPAHAACSRLLAALILLSATVSRGSRIVREQQQVEKQIREAHTSGIEREQQIQIDGEQQILQAHASKGLLSLAGADTEPDAAAPEANNVYRFVDAQPPAKLAKVMRQLCHRRQVFFCEGG